MQNFLKLIQNFLFLFFRYFSTYFVLFQAIFHLFNQIESLSGAALRYSTTAVVSPLLSRSNLGRRPRYSGEPLQALCLFFLSILKLFWYLPTVLFSHQRTQDRTKGFPPHKLRLRLLYEVSYLRPAWAQVRFWANLAQHGSYPTPLC